MTVTLLHDANQQQDDAVVEVLEQALEMAKRGQLRSVAVVGEVVGNETYVSYCTENLLTLIGLLSFTTHTVSARKRENARDP